MLCRPVASPFLQPFKKRMRDHQVDMGSACVLVEGDVLRIADCRAGDQSVKVAPDIVYAEDGVALRLADVALMLDGRSPAVDEDLGLSEKRIVGFPHVGGEASYQIDMAARPDKIAKKQRLSYAGAGRGNGPELSGRNFGWGSGSGQCSGGAAGNLRERVEYSGNGAVWRGFYGPPGPRRICIQDGKDV